MVKKYWYIIGIGVQNTLVYRVNFLLRALFGLIPLTATIFLWKAVFAEKAEGSTVAGYTLASMVSYYLVVTVVDALTAVTEDDWQISADIKDGNINQFLLKPVDYLRYRLCLFVAGRFVYLAAAAVPVAVFVLVQREYFVIPVHAMTWVWFAGSIIMAALLNFFISYSMAMLAFWVVEISTFIFILFAFEYIAGGHLFPVDIMPAGLLEVLNWTPFPYQLFFPVSVYLERSQGLGLWRGLGIQFFWVIFFFGVARLAWSRGVRKYTAVGG